jgi:hypothetical protein
VFVLHDDEGLDHAEIAALLERQRRHLEVASSNRGAPTLARAPRTRRCAEGPPC